MTSTGTKNPRARSFRLAVEPGRSAGSRPNWEARIRTNGLYRVGMPRDNPDYARRMRRHQHLTLLRTSPARETPECQAIIELTERLGVSLAAVPYLYHSVWETRTAESRMAKAESPETKAGMGMIANIILDEFKLRLRQDLGVEPGPIFEELAKLDLHPTVFFGNTSIQVTEGEPLLDD